MYIELSKKEKQAIKRSYFYIKNWKYFRILFIIIGISIISLAFIFKENDFLRSFAGPIAGGIIGGTIGCWNGPIKSKILAKLIDHI